MSTYSTTHLHTYWVCNVCTVTVVLIPQFKQKQMSFLPCGLYNTVVSAHEWPHQSYLCFNKGRHSSCSFITIASVTALKITSPNTTFSFSIRPTRKSVFLLEHLPFQLYIFICGHDYWDPLPLYEVQCKINLVFWLLAALSGAKNKIFSCFNSSCLSYHITDLLVW